MEFLEACQEYRQQINWNPGDEFSQILNTGPEFAAPDRTHAVHHIVRGALQITASRLLDQTTQLSGGEHELHDGIEHLERARAEDQEQFARAQQMAAAVQAARRRDERTYLVGPLRPPVLLDEGLWPGLGQAPRSAEELTAAEERLYALGFVLEADGNVIAWKYRQEPYAVLADPRVRGRLTFCVYDEARLGASSRRRRRQAIDAAFREGPLFPEFYLLDTWRNDIVGKFRTRLQQAIATIDRDSPALPQ